MNTDGKSERPDTGEIRISPNVLYRELVDEAVLLDLKSQRYYGLDPVGNRLWQLVRERGRIGAVVRAMLEEYEIDEHQLREDFSGFLRQLEEAGLIELIEPAGP